LVLVKPDNVYYLHLWPGLANLSDYPLDFLPGPCCLILVGLPQSSAKKEVSAKNIQRQIAVIAVVAVKEAAFLIAMKDVVSSIEIEDDPLGRLVVRLQKKIDEDLIDLLSIN